MKNKVEITGQKHNKQAAGCDSTNKRKGLAEPLISGMCHGNDIVGSGVNEAMIA